MENFSTFTEGAAGQGLTIFDIDRTLFNSDAKINIKKGGKIVKRGVGVYHKLGPGEKFDYGEYKSAKKFAQTASPIGRMIAKAKAIIKNATKTGSKVIFVTARGDMDDKKLFINTFKAHGLDMSKVHIERAGNLGVTGAAQNKQTVFKKYLDSGKFARVRMFDDDVINLKALLALKNDYSNITFNAWLVNTQGTISTVR